MWLSSLCCLPRCSLGCSVEHTEPWGWLCRVRGGGGGREGSFIGGGEERAPLGSKANVAQPSELRLAGILSSLKKGADCNVS